MLCNAKFAAIKGKKQRKENVQKQKFFNRACER
jgi:hypothetical protein